MSSQKMDRAKKAQKKRGEQPEQRKDFLSVDPRSLDVIEGMNIREEYGDIKDLAASIEANGCKMPLMGYRHPDIEGRFIVTAGARRRLAGLMLVKKGVEVMLPLVLQAKTYKDTDRIFDMLLDSGENHKPLTMLEQAEGVRRLVDEHKLKDADIAKRFSKSKTFIRNLLLLQQAPQDIKDLLNHKLISPTLVITLMKENGINDAVQVIRDTYEGMNYPQIGENVVVNEELQNETYEAPFPGGTDDGNDGKPVVRDTVAEAPELKHRISRADIDRNTKKHNSIRYFQKMIDRSMKDSLNPIHGEEFAWIQRIVEGDVSLQEMEQKYFGEPDFEGSLEMDDHGNVKQ